jgi:nitrite reductase (NAD(P)H)
LRLSIYDLRKYQAAVIGGGLLGLEAAKALYDLSPAVSQVSIVHRQNFPLSRQLDSAGGEIVLRRIEALGVRVIGNVEPTGLSTSKFENEEVLEALVLNDGSTVPCKTAVFAIGIKPRKELALSSGIACGGPTGNAGIIVNDELRTSAEDVYAIGECASWEGQTYGLIAPGIEMADILAWNLTQTQTEVGGYAKRKMVSRFYQLRYTIN